MSFANWEPLKVFCWSFLIAVPISRDRTCVKPMIQKNNNTFVPIVTNRKAVKSTNRAQYYDQVMDYRGEVVNNVRKVLSYFYAYLDVNYRNLNR